MKTKPLTLITIPERGDVAISKDKDYADKLKRGDMCIKSSGETLKLSTYNPIMSWPQFYIFASSFPIPGVVKIVDEAEREADRYYPYTTTGGFTFMCKEGAKFKEGFNRSKELRPFTEKDMIEFASYLLGYISAGATISEPISSLIKAWLSTRERTILLPVSEQGEVIGDKW